MQEKFFVFFILLISFVYTSNEYNATITFSNSEISSSGEGVDISGSIATIKKSGLYLVTGASSEGNIIISTGSVELNLQDLNLTSSTNSPIIVNSKLENVTIISLGNVFLQDLEEETTTKGECAVIKIKKKSVVTFSNKKDFKLDGKCKNVIKGGSLANIIFDDSNGEYTINAYKNGISSDNLVLFHGGKFNIITETGDAVKSSPDDNDKESLGRIFIYSGIFYIQSKNDGFQAANRLLVKGGSFIIKTENGYNSETFDKETMSAKGFKVSNNNTGCEIRIYDGEFDLNTADDAFHSNGNLTLINGKYKIYSKDDGLHADFHVIIGTKDQTKSPYINILHSYEAIEGMSIRIYSGKINATATDDGINSAGGTSEERPGPPGPPPNPDDPRPPFNPDDPTPPFNPDDPRPPFNPDDPRPPFNPDDPRPGPGPRPRPGGRGNSSYFLSVYGGEINVYCSADGIDSNGNIFIHGGDINIFSQANSEGRDNEPVDHDGNFTLFDGTLFGAGNRGMEYVHNGISKGNQMYAYYNRSIEANKILKIKDENNGIIKEVTFPKTVNYTFFTCKGLTRNYKFYLSDNNNGEESEISFYYGVPKTGLDDQDTKIDDGGKYNGDIDPTDTTPYMEPSTGNTAKDDIKGKGEAEGNNSNQSLGIALGIGIPFAIILIIVIIIVVKKLKKKDINKDFMLEEGDHDILAEE